MFRFICAIAVLGAATWPRYADAEPIFQSGDWMVSVTRGGDNPGCEAGVYTSRGHASLTLDKHGLDLNLRDPSFATRRAKRDTVLLWVDRRQIWRVPVSRSGDFMWVDIGGTEAEDLLVDMVEGRRLYVDINLDGTSEAEFSLAGSKVAFPEFVRCPNLL